VVVAVACVIVRSEVDVGPPVADGILEHLVVLGVLGVGRHLGREPGGLPVAPVSDAVVEPYSWSPPCNIAVNAR